MDDARRTHDERAAVLHEVLGDDIVTSMDLLRRAVRSFVRWPWSSKRQEAFMVAWEDVMVAQVTRITSTTWTVMEGPIARATELRDDLTRTEGDLISLEERVIADERGQAEDTKDTRDLINDLYRHVEEPRTAQERVEEPGPPSWVHPDQDAWKADDVRE